MAGKPEAIIAVGTPNSLSVLGIGGRVHCFETGRPAKNFGGILGSSVVDFFLYRSIIAAEGKEFAL
jgi:hypothetical protein